MTSSQESFIDIFNGNEEAKEDNNLTFTNAKLKLAHHPEIVSTLLAGQTPSPISMEVDLSYFCGDSCNFCHFAYTHENPQPSAFLSIERASLIFDKLKQGGVKSVIFSGGGEPLDNRNALQIFQLASDYKLEMGMYTRGYGLREEVADFVAQNFSWIVVSLDVTNPEDHKRVKGTGERIFQRKVNNILEFSLRPNRKADISVSLLVDRQHLDIVEPYEEQKELLKNSTVLTKVERDILWMLGLDTDEVQVRPIVDTGNYQEQRKNREISGMAFKTDTEAWQQHYSWIPLIRNLLARYNSVPGLNVSDDKFEDLYEGVSGWGTCDGMVLSAGLVDIRGIIYKCVNLRGITPIGDLARQTMMEIYSPSLDRSVDTSCRAGCRGCKVNQAMHGFRSGQTLTSPNPKVRHPNFI